MTNARVDRTGSKGGKVVEFDQGLLDACPPDVRAEILTEASLLAQALRPEERSAQLTTIADALASRRHEGEPDRLHARRLAAALRRLARNPQG